MIKIRRRACPPVLEDATPTGEHYKSPEVIKTLFDMQYEKCCYCEQKVPEQGHGRAVEHYRPKSKCQFSHLKNVWENLLLACSMCNGKKWNHFPTDDQGNPLVIDPSDPNLDPEDHIDFIVDDDHELFGHILPKANSMIGSKTIETIGLYREYYRQMRMIHYKELYLNYLDILSASDNTSRRANIIKFESLMGANSRFAAFARKFAREKRLDIKYRVRIPEGFEVLDAE